MNLYELTNEYMFMMHMIEDGIEDDQLEKIMNEIEADIEDKADNYAKVIRNMEGSIAAIDAEMKRLRDNKAAMENGIKRMKENLQNSMIATGKTKFKTELFSFNIQKNGGATPVIVDVDVSELSDDLVVITKKPNLKAISDYIKETGDVTYAHFGERGESLRIK